MLFDLFHMFRGFVYMPARRPNMIRGSTSYELRIEFCFRDAIGPCDPVSGHGMTGMLKKVEILRFAQNDDIRSE